MEKLSIKNYEFWRAECLKKGDKKGVKEYDEIIKTLKGKLPHECGSNEFYLSPVVHIRCAECNQPL